MKPPPTEHHSELYSQKSVPQRVWGPIVRREKRKLYEHFANAFPPREDRTILNLGVNAARVDPATYILENNYPYLEQITAGGLESGERFEIAFPGVRYVQLSRHEGLPFEDNEFDLVFCNAVIEHVGSRQDQQDFLKEILRVGRSAFVTTPNRWHPIEFHTVLPLTHYLPSRVYRRLWGAVGLEFFADEANLNLLDRRSFLGLLPPGVDADLTYHHFLGFRSNLLLSVRDAGE